MVSVRDIMVDPPADGEIVDPMAWFNAPGPFEVEIGCGKGGFLLSRARSHPHIRLLGIEWANKYYRYCGDRMSRWGVTNVRVMRTDARHFVIHHLPPACVSVLHVYHPDPWPKKRHHKRRLFQADFVSAVVRVLQPGGFLRVQSDHHEYFDLIRSLLDGVFDLEKTLFDDTVSAAGEDWAGTNFEIKYTREGRPIHRVAYRLRS